MSKLVRHQFQHFARQYIGQPDFSGYHSTNGEWVYNHNFINMNWKMWQECQNLNDEKLAEALSEKECEIHQGYRGLISQQSETARLREQLKVAVGALEAIYFSEWQAASKAQQALAQIKALQPSENN